MSSPPNLLSRIFSRIQGGQPANGQAAAGNGYSDGDGSQPAPRSGKSYQIKLSEAEQNRLINRIEQDFQMAKASHMARCQKFASYMQRWENRVDPPQMGDEDKPNHTVPLTQWQCFAKMARDLQALIGDDAEITARPTGPSDAAAARKVGAYMTSRVFDQMELLNPLAVFQFRRILFGRAIAYRPWYEREFDWMENGKRKRVCDYRGPGFFPCEPDYIVVPPERGVQSIQDFSYVIRRVPVTVDDLQHGDGSLYQGTSDPEFVKEAINWAKNGYNDYMLGAQDPVQTEVEQSQGIDYDSGNPAARRIIWLWEWFGKWRPLKRGTADGDQDDLDARQPFEADWVVRFIPGWRKIVGVQDLMELYPRMRKRRPFCESSLIKDGNYWCQGFGALLESIEDEATANGRLFTATGELSVWPIIFYKPGGGMNPKLMRLEPGMAIPTEDPAGVNVIRLSPNLEYAMAKNQETLATAERVTGITDQSLGRAIDRPNAPRTATGQLALIEEGNVRAYLDSTVLREDMEQIIADFWYMDCDLAPKEDPGIWFRVTESASIGAAGFDVAKGGAYMTPEEFGGRFDFRLKFATSAWSREAQAQKQLTFYSLAMQNPLVMQNPRALWMLLNETAKALGVQDFSDIIPQPPDLDQPISPDQEWTKMLEGDDDVHPNPQDNDDYHLQQHAKQLASERAEPNPDAQAHHLLVRHIQEQQQQKASKMAVQALTQQLVQSIQPQNQPPSNPMDQLIQQVHQQGGMPGGGLPGMPPGMPPPGPAPGGAPQGPQMAGVPPMPPPGVGSSAAPQAQNGML